MRLIIPGTTSPAALPETMFPELRPVPADESVGQAGSTALAHNATHSLETAMKH